MHYTALNRTLLHCIVHNFTALHSTAQHCTAPEGFFHSTTQYFNALHSSTIHCTVVSYQHIPVGTPGPLPQEVTLDIGHCTELNCIALHCNAIYCNALNFTAMYSYCTELYFGRILEGEPHKTLQTSMNHCNAQQNTTKP